MGEGNASVSQRAQQPSLGYAPGDDEPELYNASRPALGDPLQLDWLSR